MSTVGWYLVVAPEDYMYGRFRVTGYGCTHQACFDHVPFVTVVIQVTDVNSSLLKYVLQGTQKHTCFRPHNPKQK